MTIKIEMLRSFCTVAKAGNLADAANQLGRTQSAVSMTLKQLESHLGSPLFESERKNRLTPLGEQVFDLGRRQLREFDSTVQSIELSARAPQGVLRIAAVPSVAALVYTHLVAEMTRRYPNLKLELRDTDTVQVIDALLQGWADIGIASENHVLNGVTTKPLFQDAFGLIVSQDHPLANTPEPLTIEQVLAVPLLRNPLCNQIGTPRFRERLEDIGVMVHNTHSLLTLVQSGDWVTVLPRSVIAFAHKELRFRPIVDLPDQRNTFLYFREQPLTNTAANDAYNLLTSRDWLARI